MLRNNRKLKSGFTIIEVMIVLAIAGLIMLIVFLAVPALQRSSRNTDRKEDVGRISSAINDWVANNNGSLPPATVAGWVTAGDCATILSDAGSLSIYNTGNGFACGTLAVQGNDKFDVTNGVQNFPAESYDAVTLDEDTQCPAASGTAVTTQAGTSPRQASLMYEFETNNGSWIWDCNQAQ